MPYAFVQDVPIDESMYREVRAEVGSASPAGLIVHVALERPEGGLRFLNVWESHDAWSAFHNQRLQPAIEKALANRGTERQFQPSPPQTGDVIDVWQGA